MAGRKGDLNIQGIVLHMAADAAVSLGVVAVGILIGLTGWLWLDPAVSILIGGVIVWSTWGLLRDSVNLAMDAVPQGIDPHAVEAFLAACPACGGARPAHLGHEHHRDGADGAPRDAPATRRRQVPAGGRRGAPRAFRDRAHHDPNRTWRRRCSLPPRTSPRGLANESIRRHRGASSTVAPQLRPPNVRPAATLQRSRVWKLLSLPSECCGHGRYRIATQTIGADQSVDSTRSNQKFVLIAAGWYIYSAAGGTSDDRDFKTGRFEERRLSNLPQRVSGLLTAARPRTDPGVLAEDVVVMPRETAALWRARPRSRELGNRARFWQRLIRFRQFDWNRSRFWCAVLAPAFTYEPRKHDRRARRHPLWSRLEQLEARQLLTATVWINDDWAVMTDNNRRGSMLGHRAKQRRRRHGCHWLGVWYPAFASIAAALPHVDSGGTVNVMTGGYAEAVQIATDPVVLTLLGNITIDSLASSLSAARVALAGFSLTTENVSDTTFDGTLTGGPQSQLIKQGVGKLTLTGASDDFAGAVTLNAGTLQLTNASAIGDGLDSVAVQSAGTLEISGVTLNRDIRLDDGATLRGTGAAISQGVVTVANGGNIFLATDSVADSLTFGDSNHADRLTGGAGSTLTVSGAGKVVLTAGNDLAANVNWTVMNGGTIDISSDQQLSSAISPSGILELQGGTLEVTASTILASGRQIKLAGASGTIEISGVAQR